MKRRLRACHLILRRQRCERKSRQTSHPIDEDLSMGAPEAEDDDCGGPTV
jgi:hypothetical protein